MAEFVGSACYAQWLTAGGGTVDISTNYRTFQANRTVNEVDKSAGADTERTYIPTLIDKEYSGTFIHTGSTTDWSYLEPGTQGTLTWGEQGTTSGMPKHTCPAFIRESSLAFGYEELAIFNLTFRPTASEVYSTY